MNIDKTLLERYRSMCELELSTIPATELKPIPGQEGTPLHLLWMLKELEENKLMSPTKKHRWLGFIQGCLFLKGHFSIDEERNLTRGIFNGT